MANYDSLLHCHLTDIFFAIHAAAKELEDACIKSRRPMLCRQKEFVYALKLFR